MTIQEEAGPPPEPDRPHKARSVEIDSDSSVLELARAAIASCCEQVRANTPGARRAEDPGYVHQLRVGTRRLRVALRLFARSIDREQRRSLEHALRGTFRTLGAQRELDVMIEALIAPLAEEQETPALVALLHAAEHEREHRREQVRALLASPLHEQLLRMLDGIQKSLAEHTDHGKPGQKWARKKLDHRRDAALSLIGAAMTGAPEQRHTLRKECKKLRYACELCGALFKDKRVKHYLATLEELQDVLGALNDVAAGTEELEQLSSARHVELGSALAACQAELGRADAENLQKLPRMLSALAAARPFWR